jgi:hypothetical protein
MRLSPRASTVEDFAKYIKVYLPRTTWAVPHNSWYKMGTTDAKILEMWPRSRLTYLEVLYRPILQDYKTKYWCKNQWSYMGNGFIDWGFKGTQDLTWYLDEFSVHPRYH